MIVDNAIKNAVSLNNCQVEFIEALLKAITKNTIKLNNFNRLNLATFLIVYTFVIKVIYLIQLL